VPRSREVAIFVLTTLTQPITLCMHVRGNNILLLHLCWFDCIMMHIELIISADCQVTHLYITK
jgi:hypothetical protein